ncbi:MAG: universal stress protein [Hyphomicrobiaceae bacterium]
MPYKTILVHLNNEHRVTRLIGAAMHLALPSSAHLTGLFVVPHVPFTSPIFPKISGAIIQRGLDTYRQTGESIRQAFERAATGLPLVTEWRLHEPKRPGFVEAVLEHARAADLLIVAQKESDWDYADMFDVPDWLAMDSGRPVLIVPKSGEMETIGERILLAWNNSRESARAAFDALPLLQRAKEVRVLCVEEPDKPQTASDVLGAEICAALARHGVNCTAEHIKPARRGEPGEELLAQVAQRGCDLLVMGCYGRSRLREFILGGASRHVLKHATVPVLMAH